MRNNEAAIIGTMEKEATETEEKPISDDEFVLNHITDVLDHNMTELEINSKNSPASIGGQIESESVGQKRSTVSNRSQGTG